MSRTAPTLRDLVGGYVAEQCDVLLASEAQLRADVPTEPRPDVVHATRVAVRRLRSTGRVFADLFDVPKVGLLEEELFWWAGLLGDVRDLDILEARLTAALTELAPELVLGPVASHLQTEIGVQRKAALDVVHQALETDRFRTLAASLDRWRSDPPFTPAADAPASKVNGYVKGAGRKVTKRLAAAVVAVQTGDSTTAELLHRTRKAGKRHRYAAELAAPVLGAKADRIVADRKELQDVLGDHQDSIVSAAFLRRIGSQAGVTPGHNGFTYGLLYGRELASRDQLLTRLEPFTS